MDHSKPKSRTQIFFEKKENDRKKKKNKPKVYADRSPEGYRAFLHQVGNRNVAQFFEGALVRAKLAREQYESNHEEREADQVADAVMRAESGNNQTGKVLGSVQRRHPSTPIPGLGSGRPMPRQERTFFEQRMGGDFSSVRVHTGPTADQFARAINARAFTYGRDIAFARGEYSPGTRKGRHLMAHELTHVMQGGPTVRRKENHPDYAKLYNYYVPYYTTTAKVWMFTAPGRTRQGYIYSKNTRVNKLDRAVAGAHTYLKVEIGEGPQKGKTGWIMEQYASPEKQDRRAAAKKDIHMNDTWNITFSQYGVAYRYKYQVSFHLGGAQYSGNTVYLSSRKSLLDLTLTRYIDGDKEDEVSRIRFAGDKMRSRDVDLQGFSEMLQKAYDQGYIKDSRSVADVAVKFLSIFVSDSPASSKQAKTTGKQGSREKQRFVPQQSAGIPLFTLMENPRKIIMEELRRMRKPDKLHWIMEEKKKSVEYLKKLKSENSYLVERVEENIGKIENLFSSIWKSEGNKYTNSINRTAPIKGVYIAKQDRVPQKLMLYYEFFNNGSECEIYDLSFENSIRKYRGQGDSKKMAFNDALQSFVAENVYPEGFFGFAVEDNDLGTREIYEVNSGSQYRARRQQLANFSMGAGLAGLLVSLLPLPGARVVSGCLFVASATTGGAVSGMNIYDRLEHGSFAFDSEAALDVLGIAGSLAAGSMSAMNLARTGSGLGALSRAGSQSSVLKNLLNTQNMLLFTRGIDQGSDMLNGLIVTSVGFKNIMRIKREVQDPELRRRLIAYELMAMIAAGTMTAINIKGMRGNKTRGYVYTGPQYNYVSPFKTGFPRPLQRSVCKSLGDGEFVGLRTMPLGATVSGKVLPYKPSSVKDNIKMGAGIRIDVKTKKVYASDLDLALYAKGGKAYSNDAAIELGNEISNKYGKKIVLHGDNYNGVLIDDEGAKRVAKKNEIIYIFDKKGFVEAGNYKDMVKKYIRIDKEAKGLIGKDFEDWVVKLKGKDAEGSFKIGGREFDGKIGNTWWEAKSGDYWKMLENDPHELARFKSSMGARLRIATDNNAIYELHSNTPIPLEIKAWLIKKEIKIFEY